MLSKTSCNHSDAGGLNGETFSGKRRGEDNLARTSMVRAKRKLCSPSHAYPDDVRLYARALSEELDDSTTPFGFVRCAEVLFGKLQDNAGMSEKYRLLMERDSEFYAQIRSMLPTIVRAILPGNTKFAEAVTRILEGVDAFDKSITAPTACHPDEPPYDELRYFDFEKEDGDANRDYSRHGRRNTKGGRRSSRKVKDWE